MLPSRALVLFALLGFAGPASAQDGTPWGASDDTAKEDATESTEEAGEEDGEEAAEDEDGEKSTTRTGSAKRGGDEDAAEDDGPPAIELAEAGTEIARIEIEVDPVTSPPGGEVSFTAIFWDADDKAIPEVAFDLLGKSGEVSEVTEKDGRYTATFTVSLYAEDEAKLSVVTEDGKHEMVKIEVAGDPVEASTAVADAGDEGDEKPEAAAEKEPKEPKEKKPKTTREPTWLHLSVRGAGGLYSYTQEPEGDDSGPLIEDTLQFGGDASAPATAAGLDLSGTWWGDEVDMPYIGAQAEMRVLGYGVASGAFSGTANDVLIDGGLYALGRIPIEIGDGQAWAGGRLGFHYDDFLIFAGCLVPGCRVEFDTIGMPGLGIGPRGGIEMGDFLAELGYTASLGRFTQPYNNTLDLTVGYVVYEGVSVELGYDQVMRTIALEGKDSGDIRGRVRDSQSIFGLGVGYVF